MRVLYPSMPKLFGVNAQVNEAKLTVQTEAIRKVSRHGELTITEIAEDIGIVIEFIE